jgi:rhodanese-related sulfurtransferase
MWLGRREVALLDAREEGPYSLAHPFFAVALPFSRIEAAIFSLVPRRSAPVVVYDAGEDLAEEAASRIMHLGYTDVSVLEGGLESYALVGELFRDVNVPSKAFGELVESIRHTPSLSASEVMSLIEQQADMVVLDVRRFEEYRTMSVPSAISVPGGELALRVREIAPSPDTLVVVNCAGRTRSIIGAQTLVNAGIPNRVAALRNGTIGWTLEGYALDHGRTRRFGDDSEQHAQNGVRHEIIPDRSGGARRTLCASEHRDTARASAASWAARTGVAVIDLQTLNSWIQRSDERTLYRFDVRTPEEYQAGHPAGFISAPGGQLVQATDEWVAVRGARIVLIDDDGVRARMTGSWLAQMGWETAVLETTAPLPFETGVPSPPRTAPPEPVHSTIGPDELAALGESVVILDLAPSPVYERGHIPGAWFVLRSRFRQDLAQLPQAEALVLTSPDGWLALHAASELERIAKRTVRVLAGGTAAWTAAGRPLKHDGQWASQAIDVYKRPYEGTDNGPQAMRSYIEWELQLVAQLANDGISNFRVVR